MLSTLCHHLNFLIFGSFCSQLSVDLMNLFFCLLWLLLSHFYFLLWWMFAYSAIVITVELFAVDNAEIE